ncbi:MAG TPA: SDR family oxidoreductase [Bryobacteraceae bacterium]|nr:SDR family oxidoreductase [Bryobacteraceae bacterium]
MLESLRGREVVLAGGTGGLGSAVTSRLLKEGARVVLGFRSNRERAGMWQASATLIQADIAETAGRMQLLDAAPALYGLVVFAGDPARVASDADVPSVMSRSHQINYEGPILLAREAVARMKAKSVEGAIVLFSTMQANALFPGSTIYAAQKAALQHAARILARESRPCNIRVNVISPGVIAAGMAKPSIASGKYDRFLQDGIIPRFGRIEDVARAVRFLLEPDNYVTGQVLCVDGGMTL